MSLCWGIAAGRDGVGSCLSVGGAEPRSVVGQTSTEAQRRTCTHVRRRPPTSVRLPPGTWKEKHVGRLCRLLPMCHPSNPIQSDPIQSTPCHTNNESRLRHLQDFDAATATRVLTCPRAFRTPSRGARLHSALGCFTGRDGACSANLLSRLVLWMRSGSVPVGRCRVDRLVFVGG
jgi:hypothetical protein